MGAVAQAFSLTDSTLWYEPKYDGVRVKVAVEPKGTDPLVSVWSREGNALTASFPDLATGLTDLGRRVRQPILMDGEIVAVNAHGEPLKFQDLQSRLGVVRPSTRLITSTPVGLIVFDLLLEDGRDWRFEPLRVRRQRLEELFEGVSTTTFRLSRLVRDDARGLFEDVRRHGWEGLVAKRADSVYRSGKAHTDWRKLKLLRQQEFVVGGWTESERRPFRALLIGVYTDDGQLHYVGRMGKAYSETELKKLAAWLHALEIKHCPFAEKPVPDAPPHWVKPQLVIEAKFTEWTKGGKLCEPTYLGLRTDVDPRTVRRELITTDPSTALPTRPKRHRTPSPKGLSSDLEQLLDQITTLESSGGKGVLTFHDGHTLAVDKLKDPVWRTLKITKADLMRYYVTVSPWLLPTLADRALTYRPYPKGVEARPDRYHQRVQHPVPSGVDVRSFRGQDKDYEPRFIGGGLLTVLYMVQHHIISQDAWLSTIQTPDHPDQAVMDLDPMPGVPFQQVIDVARWLHNELDTLHVPHFLKTSGNAGLHIYLPWQRTRPFGRRGNFANYWGKWSPRSIRLRLPSSGP